MKAANVRSPFVLRVPARLRLPQGAKKPALCGLGALALAAFGLGGGPLPLAAAWIFALPTLPAALCAAVGACVGYVLFWPWPAALEPLAVSLLLLTAAGLFRPPERQALKWLTPALSGGISALIALVFLLDRGLTPTSLLRFVATPLLAMAVTAAVPRLWQPAPPRTVPKSEARRDPALPLQKLAGAFAQLHRLLAAPVQGAGRGTLAPAYDTAAEQVCRMCVRSGVCWQTQARATYDALCSAAPAIRERGSALREDFPAAFVGECQHMEGFLTAVNGALDAERGRRQMQNRMQEGRSVLASQALFLSRFLQTLAQAEDAPAQAPRFVPEFAVNGVCRPGSSVSGDRGASLCDAKNNFYVLLCDGMGSGEEAARQSAQAVHLLTSLLEAGAAPDAAMALLNGAYLLRPGSAFATVDLLQLSLVSGEGVLYKWGAAPSYVKTGGRVDTVGTAAPPPGLGTGPDQSPQQHRVSLRDGQILIMVSDGAFGQATEQRAAAWHGTGCRELAGCLIAGLQEQNEDDLTAAVLRLAPVG